MTLLLAKTKMRHPPDHTKIATPEVFQSIVAGKNSNVC